MGTVTIETEVLITILIVVLIVVLIVATIMFKNRSNQPDQEPEIFSRENNTVGELAERCPDCQGSGYYAAGLRACDHRMVEISDRMQAKAKRSRRR